MKWLRKSWRRHPARPAAPRRAHLRVELLETRVVPYALSGNAWPVPRLITVSFVPDGTIIGSSTSGYVYSNLFATFNARFGSASAWQTEVLRGVQLWAAQTNINFAVVPDNGTTISGGNYQQGDPGFGDIRISGANFGAGGALGWAFGPPPGTNYSLAGDVILNTGQGFFIGDTYDLATVASHEVGHALGLNHSTNYYAQMFPYYTGEKWLLHSDDVAGIRAVYSAGRPRAGDGLEPNNDFATATDLSPYIDPASGTLVGSDVDITTTSDVDYYTFTAPAGTTGTLRLTVQTTGLSLLAPSYTLYAADQTTVLASGTWYGPSGGSLSATVNGVTAGQRFYLKVYGSYGGVVAWGTGRYGITLNFGSGPSPAIAPTDTQTPNGFPLQTGGGQAENGDDDQPPFTAGVRPTTTAATVSQVDFQTAVRLSRAAQDLAFASAPVAAPAVAAPTVPGLPAPNAVEPTVSRPNSERPPGNAGLGSEAADQGESADPKDPAAVPPKKEGDKPAPKPKADEMPDKDKQDKPAAGEPRDGLCDACFAEAGWLVEPSQAGQPEPAPAAGGVSWEPTAGVAALAVTLGGCWARQADEPSRRRLLGLR